MVACFSVVLHPIGKIQPLVIGLYLPQQVESPCWLLVILFQQVVGGADEGGRGRVATPPGVYEERISPRPPPGWRSDAHTRR